MIVNTYIFLHFNLPCNIALAHIKVRPFFLIRNFFPPVDQSHQNGGAEGAEEDSTPSSCDINVVDEDEESISRLTAEPESIKTNEEESQTGSLSGAHAEERTKRQRKKRASNYGLFNQIESFAGTVDTLFVYKWPREQDEVRVAGEVPDTYILQEQVCH